MLTGNEPNGACSRGRGYWNLLLGAWFGDLGMLEGVDVRRPRICVAGFGVGVDKVVAGFGVGVADNRFRKPDR